MFQSASLVHQQRYGGSSRSMSEHLGGKDCRACGMLDRHDVRGNSKFVLSNPDSTRRVGM